MVVWVEYVAESAYGIDDFHNHEIVEVHASQDGPFLVGSSIRIAEYLARRDVGSVSQSLCLIDLLRGKGHAAHDLPVLWSHQPHPVPGVVVR